MSLTLEEYKNLDTYLLYELGMAGALNENKLRTLSASQSILNESVEDVGLPDVLLQEYTVQTGDGKEYDLPSLQVSYNSGNQTFTIKHGTSKPPAELKVSPSEVEKLWSDLSIETTREFFARLGISSFEIGLRPESSIAKAVSYRIFDLYNQKYVRNSGEDVQPLPAWKKRRSYYESQAAGNANNNQGRRRPEFDEDKSLDLGSRRRNSRTVDKINNEDIMSGTFYRDRTQIKRSRLSRLLRYLKKDYSEQSSKSYGPFRVWKKTFLLGYKVSARMHFEVWYNSYDSTFSVYDMNGVEKTEGVPTLQESIRFLIRIIAQESPDDRDILSTNRAGRDLSRSIENAMSQAITPDLKRKMNEDEDAEREARAEARREAQSNSQSNNTQQNGNKKQRRARQKGEKAREERDRDSESINDRYNRAKENRRKQKEREAEEAEEERARREQEAGEEFANAYDRNREKEREERDRRNSRSSEQNTNDEDAVRDAFRNAKKNSANSANRDQGQADDSNSKMMGDGRFSGEKKRKNDGVPPELEDTVSKRDARGKFRKKSKYQDRQTNDSEIITGMIHDKVSDVRNNLVEMEGSQGRTDLDGRKYDNIADQVKRQAEDSGYTRQMLINDINNSIEKYYKTKTEKRSFLRKTLDLTTKRFRRRSAPVENPMDEAFFRKLGNTLIGRRERADFIIGFTFNDILNIEIWYITEYDEDQDKYVASFYVYDVESSKYIRTNLPYYRNAMKVVAQKMSITNADSFGANNQQTPRRERRRRQ